MPKKTMRNVYTKNDYLSDNGMLTSVWGPSMWHYLHIMSFNYPTHPTRIEKKHYRDFVLSLRNVLPCGHCRTNLKKNFKTLPLRISDMSSRSTFSRYIYNLHELVNTMLGKQSGLTYCDVRERYEHFRSRCVTSTEYVPQQGNEKGCTEPLYGKKAKCIIKIVPQEQKCDTIQIDKRCMKTRKRKYPKRVRRNNKTKRRIKKY